MSCLYKRRERLYTLDWSGTHRGGQLDTLCFSPDGDLLAAGDGDRTLVWQGAQYDLVATLPGRPTGFCRNRGLLACRQHRATQLWDTKSWALAIEGHTDTPRPLALEALVRRW